MVLAVSVSALNAGISSSIGISLKCGIGTSLADRLFILKENHNSTNHIHLFMNICKLIHHHDHIRKQSRSDPQIIILNNHIDKQIHEHKTNTLKQHLDKIDHKHNPHYLWGTIAKLSNKTQQEILLLCFILLCFCCETKTAILDITKQNLLTYNS